MGRETGKVKKKKRYIAVLVVKTLYHYEIKTTSKKEALVVAKGLNFKDGNYYASEVDQETIRSVKLVK